MVSERKPAWPLWLRRMARRIIQDEITQFREDLYQARLERDRAREQRDSKPDYYAVADPIDVQPILYKAMDQAVEDLQPALSDAMIQVVREAARALKQHSTRYRPLNSMGRVAMQGYPRDFEVAEIEVSIPAVTTKVMVSSSFDYARSPL